MMLHPSCRVAGARAVVLLLTLIASRCAEAADSARKNWDWEGGLRCGVNAAYVYLRLNDVNVTYDTTLNSVRVGEQGSTMEDLRAFISANGVPSAVVQARPRDLDSLQLPVIAHVEPDLTSVMESAARGHFIVITAIDSSHVSYIDGTTGQFLTASRDHFSRIWSGYLLTRESSLVQMLSRREIFFAGIVAIGYLLAPLVLRRRRRPSP